MLVLIVSRSLRIIERLEEIISESQSITVIHRAYSYEEANKLIRRNNYDIAILDIDFWENESLQLLKDMRKTYEKLCIIVLFTPMDNCINEQCKSIGVDFLLDKYYHFEKLGGLLEMHHLMTSLDLVKNSGK
ncbi:MAG TPA: response regulator [Chitinophagaceae bacterium]|nr:response regulator [Chitinophagaceae bacterium]